MGALRLVASIAAAAALTAVLAVVPAGASTNCGVAGAKRLASQGRLVLIQATRSDSIAGSYTDVEACIGSHSPKQVDVLSTTDGRCRVREARLASQRYVGLDIRCTSDIVDFDSLFSFDVVKDRVYRSSREAGYEDLRFGFVLAANGAIAYIRDTDQGTIVFGCDARANCIHDGEPSRHLDKLRSARGLGNLRVSANAVSWRHGTKRRSARLY